MNQKHFTIRENARFLGRNIGCIFREIMRNKTFMNAKSVYYPYTA